MKKILCIIMILTFIASGIAYANSLEDQNSMLPYKSWEDNMVHPTWADKPTSSENLSGYKTYNIDGFADRSTLYSNSLLTGCSSYKVRYNNDMTETSDTYYIYELGTGIFGTDKKLWDDDVEAQDYGTKTINNVEGTSSKIYLKTKAPTNCTGYIKGNS